MSRRTLMRGSVFDWLVDPTRCARRCGWWPTTRSPPAASTRRSSACPPVGIGNCPVHVIVNQTDRPDQVLVE
jgi:two-component system nitrogen regulation sensor histidine kinase GlnL